METSGQCSTGSDKAEESKMFITEQPLLLPTGKLDKCHAPQDAPYPADDDDEGSQLQQPDDHVDGERSSLGLDPRWCAAVEYAESRHKRPWKVVQQQC